MLKAHLLAQLDREAPRSRRVLEELPEGKPDWKPHDKSMQLGYLAQLVAIMPSWVEMMITKDDHDIAPADGSSTQYEKLSSVADYLRALDQAVAGAREALGATSEEHLAKTWQLKVRGQVAQQDTRGNMIQDTISHWSHHRGQLTVYLRLLERKVPSTFGPSADDKTFG
jgi:uncharacterized damage-inducible protein DinB